MPTSTNVTNLKINELKEAQYDTAVQQGVIGANELSILTDVDAGQLIQVATLPTASADELGNIYQFIGTTDANYTNGYFYECVSNGATPAVYSWSRVDVQPGGLVNTATGSTSLFVSDATGLKSFNYTTVYGRSATANNNGQFSTVYGYGAKSQRNNGTAIGFHAVSNAQSAIQIGSPWDGTEATNSDANTVKFCNDNGNFEIMSADGTIPADRLIHAINKYSTMPTAASTNLGWIVQFTGTTDSTYTHGHLYECVSDGQATPTYSWSEVQLGGGGSLPSQTGNSGKFLTTDGTDASWGTTINNLSIINSSASLGYTALTLGSGSSTNYYFTAKPSASGGSITFGFGTGNTMYFSGSDLFSYNANYNLGRSNFKFGTLFVKKINNGDDITVPAVAGEMAVKQVNSTITLTSAGWSSNTQTVTVNGITSSSIVWVSPAPADTANYVSAGIICSAQGTDSLTFTATTTPSAAIDVVVVAM